MGVLDFIRPKPKSSKPKKRSHFLNLINSLFQSTYFSTSSAGETISHRTALAINAVYVSCKILGETMASYSFETVEYQGGARIPIDHPVKKLFTTVANEKYCITASDFWSTALLHIGVSGNSISIIERDGIGGRPIGLIPIEPGEVQLYFDKDIGIFYKINGHEKTFLAEDVLHFKNMSYNGMFGLNPIHEQREIMGLALKQEKYAGAVYGTKPPGYIQTKESLSREDLDQVSEMWEDMTQGGNIGETPVLPMGMEYKTIPLNPSDLQYIQSRNLTDKQIYALYRIPPTMAQDYDRATWSNAEQQDIVFNKYTMLPYVKNFEQEINLKLLPEGVKAKFNMNSIMRADIKSRSEALALMRQNGIVSANEWRAMEDMNPRTDEEGDTYWQPLNIGDDKDNQNGTENIQD